MYNNNVLNSKINIQKCSYSTDKLESDVNHFNINSCNINSFNARISELYDILINKCKLDENWKFKIELISYKSIDDIKFLNNLNLLQTYLETKCKNIKNAYGNINEPENFRAVSSNENEEILKYITYYLLEFVCEIERKLKIKNYKQKIVKLLLILPNVNYYINNYVSDIADELQQNTRQINLYYNIYITLSLIVENGIRKTNLNTLCNKIINTYIKDRKKKLNEVEFISPDDVLDLLISTATDSIDKVNDGTVSKLDEIVLKCMNVILVNHLYGPGNVSSVYALLKYFYNIISNNVMTNEHTTVVTCNFIYALELLCNSFDASVYTLLSRISRNNSYKLVEKVNYFNYLYLIKSILIFLSHSTKEFEDGESLISNQEFPIEWNEILDNCYKIIVNELSNDNNKYISNYILIQLIHLYLININKLPETHFVRTIGEETHNKTCSREKLLNLFRLVSSNDLNDKKLFKYLVSTIKRIDDKFDPGTMGEVKESVNLEKLYAHYDKLENGSVMYTIMVHNGLKYIMYSASVGVTNKVGLEQLLCEGVPLVSEREVDDRKITSDKLTMMEKFIVNKNEQLVNLIPNYIKILIYINQIKISEKNIYKGVGEHEVNGDHHEEYNGVDKEVDANREVSSKHSVGKFLEEENAEIIELKDLNFLLAILINNLKNIKISTKTEGRCKLRTKLLSTPELNKYLLLTGTETTDEIEVIVDDKYKVDKKTLYHNLYYNNINIVMNIIRFISNKNKLNQVFVLKFLLTHVLYNVNMPNQNYFIFLINNIINNLIIRIKAYGGAKNEKIGENEEELVIGETLVLLYNNLNNDVSVNILHHFIDKLHENIQVRDLIRIEPLISCLLNKLYSLFKEVKVDKLSLFNTTLKVQRLIERINSGEGGKDRHSQVLLNYIKQNESLFQSVNASKYQVNVYYILLYLKCASDYNNDLRNKTINDILNNYISRTLNVRVDTEISENRTEHMLEAIMSIIKQYHENLDHYTNNNVNILPILNLLNHYIEIEYNYAHNEVMVRVYKYLVSIMNKVVNRYISYSNNTVFLDCRGYYIENSGEAGCSGDSDGVDEPKLKNYLIYKLMFEVISLIRIMVDKLDMDLHRFNILLINYIINIRNISIIDKLNNLLSTTLRKYVNTSAGALYYNSFAKVKNHVKDEVESEDTRKECGKLDEANELFKDFISCLIVKHFSNSDVKTSRNGVERVLKSKITVNCTEENNKLMFYIHYIVNILLHNDYTNIKVSETISGSENLDLVCDFEEFEVKVSEMDINIRCEYISMIFMTIIKTINNKNAGNKVLMINNIITLLLEIIDCVNVNVVINILRYIYRCVHSKYINSTTLNNTINNIKSIYDNADGKFTINWKLNNSILLLLSTIISCHTLNTTDSTNRIRGENPPKPENQLVEIPNTIGFDNKNADSVLRLIKKYKTKYVSLFIYYFHQINSILENSNDGDGYHGLSAQKHVAGSLIKYCINNKLLSNNKLYLLLFKFCYKTRHKFLNYLLKDLKENYAEIAFCVKFHLIQIFFDSPKCYDHSYMTRDNSLIINVILLKMLNDWDIKIRNEVKEKIKKAYIRGHEDSVMNEEIYSYEYIILSSLYANSRDLFYSISYYFINFYNNATKTRLSTSNAPVSDDLSVIYEAEDEDDGGVNIIKNILLVIRNKEKDQRMITDLINKLYFDASCNSLKSFDEDSVNGSGREDFIEELRVDNIILYSLQNIKDDITRDIIINL